MNKSSNNILIKDNSDNGILRLILNDQENKNALSKTMMEQIKDSLNSASLDDSVKVIVIAGNGDVFSAGHNLKEITDARENEDAGKAYFNSLFNLCSSLMQLIVNCKKPIIAEVNGVSLFIIERTVSAIPQMEDNSSWEVCQLNLISKY